MQTFNNPLMAQSGPNPSTRYPLPGYDRMVFLNQLISHPQIEIGDYTYYDDFEDSNNFERNVRYLFDFTGDKLIIGKFCMIASDVQFIMNGANHMIDSISSYPFAVFGNGWEHAMEGKSYPYKGNTVIGNDVWLGHKSVILPGVKVGDGSIVGAYSVVTKDVPPYTIVGGNPAKEIRKRFSDTDIEKLLNLSWWDWRAEKITQYVHLLTGNDLSALWGAATDE